MFYTVNLAQDSSKLSKYLSSTLLDEIEKTLEKGEKVLLYLNKRGSYSSLACKDCQYLWECPNCDASLSVHTHPAKLICHLCASQFDIPLSCPKCHGTQLLQIGVGTQHIEEALKKYFGGKNIVKKGVSSPKDSSLNSYSCSHNTSLNSYSCLHNTSLNSLLPGEMQLQNNIVGNYYATPEYVKDIMKNLRSKQTQAEEILWEIVRAKRFQNLKFRRQHPFGRYIADFYCDELKLAIELDGKIHENQKQYDEIRDEIIKQYAVTVLRIKNEEIFEDISQVLEKIVTCSLSWQERVGERCCVRNDRVGERFCVENDRVEDIKGGLQSREKIIKPISIYRFDSDSMKNISSKKQALEDLKEADIMIGTKMITTGFDFEKIGLIGVILVEQELSYPSFDASEKAYANLKQLIGRGNRKSQETKIILQTFLPKNPLIIRLTSANYKDFLSETLVERKDFLYPPYAQILTLEYRHKEHEKALDFTQKLEKKLADIPHASECKILRGTTAFKKNNTYHAKILIQGEDVRNFLMPLQKEILGNSALSIIFD